MTEPLAFEDYIRIMREHIEEASRRRRVSVDIDRNALIMIARCASRGNLGTAWAKRRLDALIDEMIRQHPGATRLVYKYEPLDADEKRRSEHRE